MGHEDVFIEEGVMVQTVILVFERLRQKNYLELEATWLRGKFQTNLGCRMIHGPKKNKWMNE